MATGYTATRRPSSGLRTAIGLAALAEVVGYVAVASWIGLGWTILLTLATSALGWLLLARQGTKALGELRLRAQEHRAPGRALGDAGLVALGGLLMLLPGFLGDLVGLLCLLPGTRAPARYARQAQSTWKQYPWLATWSKGNRVTSSIRAARKPPVASASGSRSAHRV